MKKFELKPRGKFVKDYKIKNNYDKIISSIFKSKYETKSERTAAQKVVSNPNEPANIVPENESTIDKKKRINQIKESSSQIKLMKNNIVIPKIEGTILDNNIEGRSKIKSPSKPLNSTRKMKSTEINTNLNNFTKVPNILLSNTNNNFNKITNSQINLFSQQVPSINVSLSQNLKLQMKDSHRENSEVLTQTMRSQRKKLQIKTESEENYIKINIYNSNSKTDNSSTNKKIKANNKVSLTAKKANRLCKNTQYINNTIILKGVQGVQATSLSKIKSQSVINDKHSKDSSKNNDKNLKSYVSFSVNSKSINDISLENINNNNKNNLQEKVNNNNNIILDFINNNSNKANLNNTNLLIIDYQSNLVSNSEVQLSAQDTKLENKETKNLKFCQIDNKKSVYFDKSQRSFSARNINCTQANQKKGLLVPTVKTNLYEEESKNSNENTIVNSEGSCKYRKIPMIKTLSEARYNKIINRSYSSEENTLKSPSSSKEIIETFVNKLKMIKENYNSSEQKLLQITNTTNPVLVAGNTNSADVTILPEIQIKESNKDFNFEIIYDVKTERYIIIDFSLNEIEKANDTIDSTRQNKKLETKLLEDPYEKEKLRQLKTLRIQKKLSNK